MSQSHFMEAGACFISAVEKLMSCKKNGGQCICLSHSTCLRALNCLFSISGGGLKTAKDREASRGNGEREGERA